MAQTLSADLVLAFVTALRRVISAEADPARRLAIMGDMRRQMTAVLNLAPYGKDPESERKFRTELASSMETAYFTILSSEALGQSNHASITEPVAIH
ncbi:hypothetical protein [Roseomonas sp. WA12]